MWLAPTRLAQALASGGAGDASGEVSQGFIVVETNYRVRLAHSLPGQRHGPLADRLICTVQITFHVIL